MIKLSVTTLGCPDWSLTEILTRIKGYDYEAVELRGLEAEMDLWNHPAFSNPSAIAQTRVDFANADLGISAVDSSGSFSCPDPKQRAGMVDHVRRNIDLAVALNAPFVRVFGGGDSSGAGQEAIDGWVVESLRELGDYAADAGGDVTVILETHDGYSNGKHVASIVAKVDSPHVGVLWDLHHPYRQGESPLDSYTALRPYLKLTHVKDSIGKDGRYCLLGDGDVPIESMVHILRDGNWSGYLSVEWEKRWHPGIEAPEIAFPQYAHKLREYLRS